MQNYKKQIRVFFILLSFVWIGRGIYEAVKVSFSNGIKIIVFSVVFLISLYFIQKFFMKMLALYNKSLSKSIKVNKNKAISKK